MRKTFPLHVLAQLDSTRKAPESEAPASRTRTRRKRATKVPTASPIAIAFDKLTASLQPELDDLDLAWTG